MARGVVTLGDIKRLCGVVVGRLVDIANAHEHLQDRADEIERGLDLLVGMVSLNRRGDDNDAEAVSANGVCGRHHRDVDIEVAIELLLGNNDLA